MSKQNARDQKKAAAMLERGIRSLSEGMGAELWVCRDVLSLDAEPTFDQVVKALHDCIHGYLRITIERNRKMMAVQMKAAAILLNVVK